MLMIIQIYLHTTNIVIKKMNIAACGASIKVEFITWTGTKNNNKKSFFWSEHLFVKIKIFSQIDVS